MSLAPDRLSSVPREIRPPPRRVPLSSPIAGGFAIDTLWLHDRVGRLRDGDRGAADDLVRAVGDRLDRLARRMLRDFPNVGTGADTADVVQGALLRLMTALRAVRPETTRDFTNLAAVQVRRELLDLARYFAVRKADARLADPAT